MRNWLKKKLRNQKGMTLIELLAVVVILGIIAAIAVPSIGGIIEKSKENAAVANAEMLLSAGRLYAASNSDVSGTINSDVATGGGSTVANAPRIELLSFIEGGAINDPWGAGGPTSWEITFSNSAPINVSLVYAEGTASGPAGGVTFTP